MKTFVENVLPEESIKTFNELKELLTNTDITSVHIDTDDLRSILVYNNLFDYTKDIATILRRPLTTPTKEDTV